MNKHQIRRTGHNTLTPWLIIALGIAAIGIGGFIWIAAPDRGNALPVANADVVVYKTPFCSCCHGWIEHLRESGLTVNVTDVASTQAARERLGVPAPMTSCHTAVVGGYWVEGHVPADLVQRLLVEQPADIVGIAVPGMPIGSPGMEGPSPVRYDVMASTADGGAYVYASRDGMTRPHQ